MNETGTKSRILVVDDAPEFVVLVSEVLRKEGYEVAEAVDGVSALAQLEEFQPDLIVLDLSLPDLDGMEVCRRIRERSGALILMLTARDDEIDKVLGLKTGADDYVTKPFSARELVARVKAVLRRSQDRVDDRRFIEVAGWTIDSGRREVRPPAAEPVRPTAKEFDLLWYLADHKGLVLSRAQILEAVWGYDYFGETRTVDVHIRQLRKKLDGIPIETVWGVGYRIEAG